MFFLSPMRTISDPAADRRLPPLVMVGFRITAEQRQAVLAAAKKRGLSTSAIVRAALAAFLAKRG